MRSRGGFSLVEMVIVLVLAGLVSTAAITMFSTQNRLNAAMTALGESQENARSAVQVFASELRAARSAMVVAASADELTVRIPLVIGMVCGEEETGTGVAVYFPLNGETLDPAEPDGFAIRDTSGAWTFIDARRLPLSFRGSASQQACVDAGNGLVGTSSDYATLSMARARRGPRGSGGQSLGTAVMLYRDFTYRFAASALDPARRGFFRGRADDVAVELANGFSEGSGFRYRTAGETEWRSSVPRGRLEEVEAVRLVVDVSGQATSGAESGSASFALTRDIELGTAAP